MTKIPTKPCFFAILTIVDTQTQLNSAFRRKSPSERLAILREAILSSAYFSPHSEDDNSHSNVQDTQEAPKEKITEKKTIIEQDLVRIEKELLLPNPQATSIADTMVESAVGGIFVPIGIVKNLRVNGVWVLVPLATEEASVISAASYAASILAKCQIAPENRGDKKSNSQKQFSKPSSPTNAAQEASQEKQEQQQKEQSPPSNTVGIIAKSSAALQLAQISFTQVSKRGEEALIQHWAKIQTKLMTLLRNMHKRGGGLRASQFRRLLSGLLVFHFTVDVRDAMGANIVNSAAEKVAPFIEEITGGKKLASILSNHSEERLAKAKFILEENYIPATHILSQHAAQHIAQMSMWAREDVFRTVTHNKGIMNGVTGLALATGNDTRAIEAASHALAASKASSDPRYYSHYAPLSDFDYSEGQLQATLEIPALLATVGGATSHPVAQWCRRVLEINHDRPLHAHRLNCIAAALGLAQNFAALFALVSSGIQHGHLKHHSKKVTIKNIV